MAGIRNGSGIGGNRPRRGSDNCANALSRERSVGVSTAQKGPGRWKTYAKRSDCIAKASSYARPGAGLVNKWRTFSETVMDISGISGPVMG